MTYELIQSALTALINVTAIAGLTGIALHAIYTRHINWMNTYCPRIENYTPDTREAIAPQPEQTEPTVEEAPEPTLPEQPQIELNALDPTTLRKLCTQYGITWKNVRGKGKHLTKAAMIFQLERVAA